MAPMPNRVDAVRGTSSHRVIRKYANRSNQEFALNRPSSPGRSRATDLLQSRPIRDGHRRALEGHQLAILELAQRASHRFSSRADELRDLFVCERHFDLCSVLSL